MTDNRENFFLDKCSPEISAYFWKLPDKDLWLLKKNSENLRITVWPQKHIMAAKATEEDMEKFKEHMRDARIDL